MTHHAFVTFSRLPLRPKRDLGRFVDRSPRFGRSVVTDGAAVETQRLQLGEKTEVLAVEDEQRLIFHGKELDKYSRGTWSPGEWLILP